MPYDPVCNLFLFLNAIFIVFSILLFIQENINSTNRFNQIMNRVEILESEFRLERDRNELNNLMLLNSTEWIQKNLQDVNMMISENVRRIDLEQSRTDYLISYWSNMTSNQEVMEELAVVKEDVHQTAFMTEQYVNNEMSNLLFNVSAQMISNIDTVKSSLSDVDDKIQKSKLYLNSQVASLHRNVTTLLQQSNRAFKDMADSTTNLLVLTRKNISSQLDINLSKVRYALSDVGNKLALTTADVNSRLEASKRNVSAQIAQARALVSKDLLTTKYDIDVSMAKSKSDVATSLTWTRQNVSTELQCAREEMRQQSHKVKEEVKDRLSTVDNLLENTVSDMREELNATVALLNGVVADAVGHIRFVQSNVTAKLSAISTSLDQTMEQVNAAVTSAEGAIHEEVVQVKLNMDQYISITNHQFAIENDFVKYQLAGESVFLLEGDRFPCSVVCGILAYHL